MILTVFQSAQPARFEARVDAAGHVRIDIEGPRDEAMLDLTVAEAERLRDALDRVLKPWSAAA